MDANEKAMSLRSTGSKYGPDDPSTIPVSPTMPRCWVCLRELDAGSRRRRMVDLCSRHVKQDLGSFYMQMTDTGRYQVFPNED